MVQLESENCELKAKVRELKAERDEVQAGAVAMREALEAVDEWFGKWVEELPEEPPEGINLEARGVIEVVYQALTSTAEAGKSILERLKSAESINQLLSSKVEQLDEVQAQCAVYREALEDVQRKVGMIDAEHGSLNAKCKLTALSIASEALSTTAGREMLERMRKLEQVAEAAREFDRHCSCDHSCNIQDGYQRQCPIKVWRGTLAALDERDASRWLNTPRNM